MVQPILEYSTVMQEITSQGTMEQLVSRELYRTWSPLQTYRAPLGRKLEAGCRTGFGSGRRPLEALAGASTFSVPFASTFTGSFSDQVPSRRAAVHLRLPFGRMRASSFISPERRDSSMEGLVRARPTVRPPARALFDPLAALLRALCLVIDHEEHPVPGAVPSLNRADLGREPGGLTSKPIPIDSGTDLSHRVSSASLMASASSAGDENCFRDARAAAPGGIHESGRCGSLVQPWAMNSACELGIAGVAADFWRIFALAAEVPPRVDAAAASRMRP